jgi:hypothetical protein
MACGYATQVVQVKEIMMTNSGKALDKCQKPDGGGASSDMDHGGNRKLKGRQVASRMWWRYLCSFWTSSCVVSSLLSGWAYARGLTV